MDPLPQNLRNGDYIDEGGPTLCVREVRFRSAQRLACAALLLWAASAFAANGKPRHVVILYDERADLPGMKLLDANIASSLRTGSVERIEIYREVMDLSRFDSDAYRDLLRSHLRAKYSDRPIDASVAVMGPALDFLLKHRNEVFSASPEIPIVFCGIDQRELGDRPLAPRVTGVLLKREFAPTLQLALRLHPRAKQVVVVSGTSEFDTRLIDQAREEFRAFEDRLTFRYLSALSLRELLLEVSRLPPQTILLYSTLFRDGQGEPFVPHEVAEQLSRAASVPLYGFVDQYMGHGIVGGHLYGLAAHGEAVAGLVLQTLEGKDLSKLMEPGNSVTMFDSRQLRRWGISESHLPPGTVIRFQDPSFWKLYRWRIVIAFAVIASQAALITGLLLQRRWRQNAELQTQRQQVELAHAARLATAGELSASIAHELNQPLCAMLQNASAAKLILQSTSPDLEELRAIVSDICADNHRAANVTGRLRALLKRHVLETQSLSILELMADVVAFARPDAAFRHVQLEMDVSPKLPPVRADRVHLQQVLINLILNGMDALDDGAPERRISIGARMNGDQLIEVSVSDTGQGISKDNARHVFEPFFTTKAKGMGLGLSLSRRLIEAHGGRMWAENNASGGATFRFTLPVAREEESQIVLTAS